MIPFRILCTFQEGGSWEELSWEKFKTEFVRGKIKAVKGDGLIFDPVLLALNYFPWRLQVENVPRLEWDLPKEPPPPAP